MGSSVKILIVSDKVVDHLYSPNVAKRHPDIDLIIGCGDLPYYYLEFLLTILNSSLVYVHGNHDAEKEYLADGTAIGGPSGGINLHTTSHREKDLLLIGLEGSVRYREGLFQYTQNEMWYNVIRLLPRLIINKLRYGRYLDMLVAHSPPFGIHNGDDRVHIGFKAFLWLMQVFKPAYMVHGHQHVYNPNEITETQFMATKVINIYPYKILNIEVPT